MADIEHSFEKGQLSIVGQDLTEIPLSLAEKYGSTVKRLDLSWNSISFVPFFFFFSSLSFLSSLPISFFFFFVLFLFLISFFFPPNKEPLRTSKSSLT